MYLPSAFAWTDVPSLTAFCRAHSFATIIAEGSDGPEAQHLPLLVEPAADGRGLVLHGHAAVGNPVWRATAALAVFSGPHAYVSAAWYAEGDTVPTWNYLAVHAHGPLTTITEPEASSALFARLAASMGDPGTATWQDRLSPEVAARLTAGIRWFRIDTTTLTGKAKLSQSHSDARRHLVSDRLLASVDPQIKATGAAMARVLAGGQPWAGAVTGMTGRDPQHQPPAAAAITYRVGKVDLDAAIAVYRACSLGPRRPVDDRERMTLMYAHANLVVGAYAGDLLVGVARALTDFTHSTYLADLAVRESHQRQGIGLELMHQVRDAAPSATLILLAAPDAEAYYPHVGFTRSPVAFTLRRGEVLRR